MTVPHYAIHGHVASAAQELLQARFPELDWLTVFGLAGECAEAVVGAILDLPSGVSFAVGERMSYTLRAIRGGIESMEAA